MAALFYNSYNSELSSKEIETLLNALVAENDVDVLDSGEVIFESEENYTFITVKGYSVEMTRFTDPVLLEGRILGLAKDIFIPLALEALETKKKEDERELTDWEIQMINEEFYELTGWEEVDEEFGKFN